MSNDWLMTLLSGVGGAFTGATAANERRSREAELARQVARQAMLDERQGETDRRAQFSQGLVDLARANELGYTEDIPRTQPVNAPVPFSAGGLLGGITNTVANGVVDTARRGPELTMPDGRKLTLDRLNTPSARASRAVLEARVEAARKAAAEQADKVAGAWEVNPATGQRVNKRTGEVQKIEGYTPTPRSDPVPRNRTVVVDGRTGIKYTIDPSDPSAPPTPITIDGQPVRDVPEKIRVEIASIDELNGALETFKNVVREVGNNQSIIPSVAQQRIDTARNGVMNAFRVVNGLGVINGPDMDIINAAIGDPTSIGTRIRGRGTVQQIEAAVEQMKRQNEAVRQIRARAFGLDTLNPTAQHGGGIAGDVDATLNQLLGRKP